MPTFNFRMGVTLRCYGDVMIDAGSVAAALPLLTADFIGENIEIMETTTDSGQDLAVIDVTDMDASTVLSDWSLHSLPSPYDPPAKTPAEIAAPDMLAALERCVEQLSQKRPRKTGARKAALDFDLELAIAEAGKAIFKAEGRTDG